MWRGCARRKPVFLFRPQLDGIRHATLDVSLRIHWLRLFAPPWHIYSRANRGWIGFPPLPFVPEGRVVGDGCGMGKPLTMAPGAPPSVPSFSRYSPVRVSSGLRRCWPPLRLSSLVPRIRQAIETARVLAAALTVSMAYVGCAQFGYSGATFVIALPLSESAV